MSEGISTRLGELLHTCATCRDKYEHNSSFIDEVDLSIWHDNGHVWPGYAGEPTGVDYGGSDF